MSEVGFGAIVSAPNTMIPSLQDLCVRCLLADRRNQTLQSCLQLYHSERFSVHLYKPLFLHILRKIEDSYPSLRETCTIDELKEIVPEIDWMRVDQKYNSLIMSKQRMAQLKGTVLDRIPAPVNDQNADYYPLAALVKGVVWPGNVDPANREQFLCDDDFFNVFDINKRDFERLPAFKKRLLKEQNGLF